MMTLNILRSDWVFWKSSL